MLSFPNASRSYNATKHCVSFRGYDSIFEVTFELDEGALRAMDVTAPAGEASMLAVFDRNRTKIERAAEKSFARRRRERLHELTAADF